MKYQPHDHQNYTTQFIIDHPIEAILLKVGLGKSVITLTAIQKLLVSDEVYRILVTRRCAWPETPGPPRFRSGVTCMV